MTDDSAFCLRSLSVLFHPRGKARLVLLHVYYAAKVPRPISIPTKASHFLVSVGSKRRGVLHDPQHTFD